MPRGRMTDMLMHRYPYGYPMDFARGGRRMGRRGSRGRDMNMGEGYDMARRDYRGSNSGQYDSARGDYAYSQQDMARGRRDYESGRQSDMSYGYPDMRMRDGHYPMNEGKTYYPIEAMGTFNGYYGMPEQDFARGGRDYGYGYPMYDYAGDYGETLTKEEHEKWQKKMLKEVEEKDKHFFQKEMVSQKARQLGVEMKDFNEDDLLTATLIAYTDHCHTLKPIIGANMDIYIKLGKDFLVDPDAAIKGGEKLAVYYDCIVEGEDD